MILRDMQANTHFHQTHGVWKVEKLQRFSSSNLKTQIQTYSRTLFSKHFGKADGMKRALRRRGVFIRQMKFQRAWFKEYGLKGILAKVYGIQMLGYFGQPRFLLGCSKVFQIAESLERPSNIDG